MTTPRQTALQDIEATGRQLAALRAIEAHVAEHGYPPTVRELGASIGVPSASGVAHILGVLVTRGFITREPRRPRALRITDRGMREVLR